MDVMLTQLLSVSYMDNSDFFFFIGGDKIYATIKKPLVNKYQDQLVERGCYKICYLTVVPNLGSYRKTKHDSKLFQFRTTVQSCDLPSILFMVYPPLHFMTYFTIHKIVTT